MQIGAASGLRSMAAPSQLSLHLAGGRGSGGSGAIGRQLARPSARALLGAAAVGEMIVDKLPIVPDRTDPGPLLGRVVLGSMAGGVLARLNRRSGAAGAVLGGVGALIGAHLGYRARRALTRRAGIPDLVVAAGEDVLAIATARGAILRSRG